MAYDNWKITSATYTPSVSLFISLEFYVAFNTYPQCQPIKPVYYIFVLALLKQNYHLNFVLQNRRYIFYLNINYTSRLTC